MDPSALIFVALAIAWAVYLIPKALEHHDEGVRSRTVDRFSHTMRVLARREAVSRKEARLVKAGTRRPAAPSTAAPAGAPSPAAPVPARVRREAAARAARRRRHVLAVLLLALLVVVGVAAAGVIGWAWTALPGAVVAAWLVACRLMVRHRTAFPSVRQPVSPAAEQVEEYAGEPADSAEPAEPRQIVIDVADLEPREVTVEQELAEQVMAAAAAAEASAPVAEGMWAPVPVTLPTYVSKTPARRSVRTIDLDSTGVWTSGRTAADSALAREADESARAAEAAEAERRATGS